MSDIVSREVSLIHYFVVLKRNIWVLLAACVLFGGIAAIYALTADEQYEIEVLLASADDSNQGLMNSIAGQLGPVASLALGQPLPSDKSVEAVATLTSASFVREFITNNQILPVLFSDDWSDAEESWIEGEPPSLDEAVEKWTKDVFDIRQDRDTGFWTMYIVWHDREAAARWAMDLVNAVNTHIREKDYAEAERSIEYLKDQLAMTENVAIQQSIFSLIETKMNMAMLTRVRTDYALRVIGPAVVPDEDHYAYPKRGFLIFLGIVAGLAAGTVIAFLRDYLQASRALQA